ncbi:MAG TPA: ATP-binding protein [Pyrinomonadaceae bacterium]|jgi:two-component system phosphate regulon sensor histidine kinase PhoR|nr:ATP-binding protein [Pyrinomonadaceae bacterium]
MNLRLKASLASAAVIAAACAAVYFWGAASALVVAAAALAAFVAARQLDAEAHGASREGAHLSAAPNVAAAVAAGDVPAAALLEVTMDSMREAVVIIDSTMRVVALNNSARGVFRAGGGDSALSPRRLSDLTRNPSVYSAFAAAVARGERAEVKVEIDRGIDGGGARGVYDLHVAPLRQREAVYGSDVRGAVGVLFDITRLEQLERVRQEFLSNVSHELRTPLTSIITFVETLEDVGADDRETALRFLSVIRRNAERMSALINDILELSAIEAGTVAVEPAQVRLSSLAGECFNALAPRAEARGVKLVNDVSHDAFVRADARRLEQMLTNLVDNAIKYTPAGGEVRVSHERAGARDRVHVADTGEGIAAEHLPRIFERFYRVDRARSREMGGTGLGLAIVKHLARAHGGEATARSEPGRGSTFTIELPSEFPPTDSSSGGDEESV